MKFKIQPEIFQKWPQVKIGAVMALGVSNQKSTEILQLLQQQERKVEQELKDQQISQSPEVAVWRKTYKEFGITGNKYVSSVEALLKRASKGGQLPDINSLVNLYNALSLKYKMPFGGEDLDKVKGDIVLKIANGNEGGRFIGSDGTSFCDKGEVAYCDDFGFICRRWNWREGDRTKLDQNTTNVILVAEAMPPISEEQLKRALEEISQLIKRYLGGKTATQILTANNQEWEIEFVSGKKAKEEKYQLTATIKQVKKPTQPVKIKSEPVGLGLVIWKAVENIVGKGLKFSVEHSENMDWGDYSTNVGIITHKTQEIVAKLKTEKKLKKIALKIETAGAGFINISIQNKVLITQTNEVLKEKFKTKWSGRKVSVEYTDPNPFKEFHLGHLYSNLIGESTAKIFEAAGATVWRGDFYGDAGMHISKSVWGMMQKMKKDKVTLKDLEKLSIKDRQKFMGLGYALGVIKYDEDEKIKQEITDINYMVFVAAQEELVRTKNWQPIVNYKKFIEGSLEQYPQIKAVYAAGLRWSLEYFETYYQRLGTKFDGYYPESWVGEYGVKLVEKGLKMGVLEKSEGAVVFKGEKYGLHTRVFLNKLGLPTYEAKDLGLAQAKYQDFKYDYSLNVFGKEIDEYYRVVKKAMELIEPKLGTMAHWLAHGMVNLPQGKMSSRSGNVITVEWLLNEAKRLIQKEHPCSDAVGEMVGQGAVKYALLKSSIGTDVIFDFNKSISFEGNSGPYLQYTYARAHSVLEKNGRFGTFHLGELNHEEEILLRTLYRFEEVVDAAANQLAPNLVANFIYDVAQKFNSFYNKHRVLGNDFRLWLTFATAEVLKRGLNLLGITAPEKM